MDCKQPINLINIKRYSTPSQGVDSCLPSLSLKAFINNRKDWNFRTYCNKTTALQKFCDHTNHPRSSSACVLFWQDIIINLQEFNICTKQALIHVKSLYFYGFALIWCFVFAFVTAGANVDVTSSIVAFVIGIRYFWNTICHDIVRIHMKYPKALDGFHRNRKNKEALN